MGGEAVTHSWEVNYDNHSANPGTWDQGTDRVDADTMTVRDGILKFANDDSLDGDTDSPTAVYAPGHWTSAKRTA